MPIRYSATHMNSTNVRAGYLKRKLLNLIFRIFWQYARTATERFVTRQFFAPAGYRLTPEERSYLHSGKGFQIEVNGNRIQCWRWGTGPAILFCHGWNGRGVQFQRFFAPLINGGHGIIAFDAQAHGASQGETANYFVFTDTIRVLLRRTDLNLTGIVGHSLGASAAINALAKERPELRTVLIAPALDLVSMLFGVFDVFGIPEIMYRNMIHGMERQYGYDLQKDNPMEILKWMDQEMFIVHDRDDPVTPFKDSAFFSANNPNFRLHATEGLGHKKLLSDTAVVSQCVAYLKGGPQGNEWAVYG